MQKKCKKKIMKTSILISIILLSSILLLQSTQMQNSSNNLSIKQGNWEDIPLTGPNGEPLYNYATALARTILYYEASKCGHNTDNNRLRWRGDCHMNDEATVTLSDGSKERLYVQPIQSDYGCHYFDLTGTLEKDTESVREWLFKVKNFECIEDR